MNTLIKSLFCILLLIATSCNSSNNNSGKVAPGKLDPKFLTSIIIVDNSTLDPDVGQSANFSIQLNDSNVFVRTDSPETEYKLELLDSNDSAPDWLVNNNTHVFKKSSPQPWTLTFAPKMPQEGIIHILVSRDGVSTRQTVEIKYHADTTVNDDFISLNNKNFTLTKDTFYTVDLHFNPDKTIIKGDEPNTNYSVQMIVADGSSVSDIIDFEQVPSFVKKGGEKTIPIRLNPKIIIGNTKFYLLVTRSIDSKVLPSIKQKQEYSVSIKDSSDPDNKDIVIVPKIVEVTKSQKSTMKIVLNKDNPKVSKAKEQTKYQISIINITDKDGQPLSSDFIEFSPATITKTSNDQRVEDSADISINPKLIASGNFQVQIETDGELPVIIDGFVFNVLGEKEDSTKAEDMIELEKGKDGTIKIALNVDSEDYKQDTGTANYQVSFVDSDGTTLKDEILKINSSASDLILKKNIHETQEVKVLAATVNESGQPYKLQVTRAGVSTLQKFGYHFIAHDQDPVISMQEEVLVPQSGGDVDFNVVLNPDSDAVSKAVAGTTYDVSVLDSNDKEFNPDILTIKEKPKLSKGDDKPGVLKLSFKKLDSEIIFKIVTTVSTGSKVISRNLHKFTVANMLVDFTITKADIKAQSGGIVWTGGMGGDFMAYKDFSVNDFGVMAVSLYTEDYNIAVKYTPFVITDKFENKTTKFDVCKNGDTNVTDMQSLALFPSMRNVFIFEPTCYEQSSGLYIANYFYNAYGKDFKFDLPEDFYGTPEPEDISNNGRYILSSYDGLADRYLGVLDLDTNQIKILQLDGKKIKSSDIYAFGITDDGLVWLENYKDQKLLYICKPNATSCTVLGTPIAGLTDTVVRSSNGNYFYGVTQVGDKYNVVNIDIDNGSAKTVVANLQSQPGLQVSNTNVLLVNVDNVPASSMVYNMNNSKSLLFTDLAKKYGINDFTKGMVSMSDNGKYVLVHQIDDSDTMHDQYSALYRKYRPNGIENDIT